MIRFSSVNKYYGTYKALDDINAEVAKRRGGRGVRSVRLRQVDADPDRQPAGGDRSPARSPSTGATCTARCAAPSSIACAAASASSSRASTSFPHLSALDNVTLSPMKVNGVKREVARATGR